MALLPLVVAPDPRLSICSEPVDSVDDKLRLFLDDMVETMYKEDGVGLAAVQVGVQKRIFVLDLKTDGVSEVYHFINPEIIETSEEESIYEEGCLSFPGQSGMVTRPQEITVKYLDYNGKEKTLHADGLMATCIQHEIDHINGVVFIDHLSKLKHDMIMRKMKKAKKAEG